MFQTKQDYISTLLRIDNTIKDIDTGVNDLYLNDIRKALTHADFFVTVYYHSGVIDVINIIERVHVRYTDLAIEYVNNFLTSIRFQEYYELSNNDIKYINLIIDS